MFGIMSNRLEGLVGSAARIAEDRVETKKPADLAISGLLINPGSVLLSHSLAAAVSSALEDLTSVFGMGTGVTPPAWPPGRLMIV